jgi:PAS domain S-box-containing protein
MEEALRNSEQRYATAMQAINEAVYEWDIATGEMYYSPRLYDLIALTPQELSTRQQWLDRVYPDDMPHYRAAIIAHLKGETERLEVEYRYRHADGSWHWARQHGIASRDQNRTRQPRFRIYGRHHDRKAFGRGTRPRQAPAHPKNRIRRHERQYPWRYEHG